MIASGAQVRAARGLLGWSQADLAKAAGLAVNAVRHWEAQHGERLHRPSARGKGPRRIAEALRRAGVVLTFDLVGVAINADRYPDDLKPPIYTRWEKYWKSDSKRAQARCRTEFRMLVKQIPRP